MSKSYNFQLNFGRCKQLFSSKLSDGIPFYLLNLNNEALKIKWDLYIISEEKTKRCRSTFSTVFGHRIFVSSVWGYSSFLSVKKLAEHASFYLPEGCLTLRCDITIYNPQSISKTSIQKNLGIFFIILLYHLQWI